MRGACMQACWWAWLVLLAHVHTCTSSCYYPIFYAGIQQLLVSLEKLSPRLEGRQEDIQFLKDMLQTEEFHSIMRV